MFREFCGADRCTATFFSTLEWTNSMTLVDGHCTAGGNCKKSQLDCENYFAMLLHETIDWMDRFG
jgi:hypothetical protein